MKSAVTISTAPLEHPAMDYAFLRREGIRLLEQLSGGQWTDFNTHDPGITILEQVCYAITDLAYRINFDLKDLLASGEADLYHSLYSPAEVLTTNPVTLNDLRKLVIDVPGVKNAWIERVDKSESEPALLYDPSDKAISLATATAPLAQHETISLRGLYRVLIEKDADSTLPAPGILTEVNRRIHACRPLAEDFTVPEILAVQGVIVNASIEIGPVDDSERLLAKIHVALAEFISPHIQFYTLTDMLNRGKDMDEIMNGPVLEHGFIDDDELEKLQRKTSLRTSDLIQEIMKVEGVIAIHKIGIKNTDRDANKFEDWYLTLDADRAPFFATEASLATIRLVSGGIERVPNLARVRNLITDLQTTGHAEALANTLRDFRVAPGRDRKIGQYHSIQQQFPATYGIGALGLPESAPPRRQAQAKQLKAYLMFFDQLLANYFAQLANAHQLFAFHSSESHTYFSQIIEDASLGLAEIRVKDIDTHAAELQSISEDAESAHTRRHRFLNHLLARFAEQFDDVQVQDGDLQQRALIKAKAAFLQTYKEIGAGRGSGFDYTRPATHSGLEQRIRYKLGLAEGELYMLEHILLRPRGTDSEQSTQTSTILNWQAGAFLAGSKRQDPYSQQISFVFPQRSKRFEAAGVAGVIEKTVREETPAHLRVYIHRLEETDWRAFESAYKDWLENIRVGGIKLRAARDRVVQLLGLGLPYPLRDLNLLYPPMIAFDQSATIQIEDGQIGVLYQLCDEDGNPIVVNGNRFEVRPQASGADEKVLLSTPQIHKDITFTILAIREGGDPLMRLEVYLNQAVSLKSGIDPNLLVTFQPMGNQIVSGNQIITDYESQVTIRVEKSQEGISYELVTGTEGNRTTLSAPQKGNTDVITLTSTVNFTADTPLNILAYRTANRRVASLLNTNLSVKVRPNPAVAITLQPLIIDYGTEATLSLSGHQATASYQLYKRELKPADYLAETSAGNIEIHTDEARHVFIKAPENITDWEVANGFVPVAEFTENSGILSISTGPLPEDTLFIVRATKSENGQSLQLDQAVVVLVRPDRSPIVTVSSTQAEMIEISNTQKGVAYQLRAGDVLVNPPGYHVTDRGVNTTRLEVDFVVEGQGDPVLLMPTGPITETTTFNVLASKIFTGLSAQLKDTATLEVAK